jgi:hypothetical protein
VGELDGLRQAVERKLAMLAGIEANQRMLRALAGSGVPALKLSGLWPRPVTPHSQESDRCT